MACRNYDIRDAALPILPSGRVAFELISGTVDAVDPNEVTPYQHKGRVFLAADGQALPLSEAYGIEEVRYYLEVARNMADEIAFQNSISL